MFNTFPNLCHFAFLSLFFFSTNCLNKSDFNNVSRLNHSSPMNNTATNKIKHSQQLFALGPQIVHVCSFLVPTLISENSLDINMITGFCLSHCIELNITKPSSFEVAKRYFVVIIMLLYPLNTAVFSVLGAEG